MIRVLIAAACLALGSCVIAVDRSGEPPSPARAAASAPAPRDVALDFRRTSLVVRDMDASLAFYRDALGMKVIYDNVIRTPRDAPDDASAERVSRLVFLRANDDYIGVIGLLEYRKPVRPPRPVRADDDLRPGDVVLVFAVDDQAATFARASASPGVKVGEAPHLVTYPSYDGTGVIRVNFSSVYDPDGHYIELNQVLDALPVGDR